MTPKPWTAEDRQQVIDALAEIYVLADAGDEHDQRTADAILSLLNERGLLKKKDDLCVGKTDRITMDMMSAAFPHLVSRIRAEERACCAKIAEEYIQKCSGSEFLLSPVKVCCESIAYLIRALPPEKEEGDV